MAFLQEAEKDLGHFSVLEGHRGDTSHLWLEKGCD